MHISDPFSKSKFNLKSDRVNLLTPASHGLVLLESALFNRRPGDTVKLGPERLTRLGNSNVPRRPVLSERDLRWNLKNLSRGLNLPKPGLN